MERTATFPIIATLGVQAVIFDLVGVILEKETREPYPWARELLKTYSSMFPLGLISVGSDTIEAKFGLIRNLDLAEFFKVMLFSENTEDKLTLAENALGNLGTARANTLWVDDRMKRLSLGIKSGFVTAWIMRGAYPDELPNAETGHPDIVLTDSKELLNLI